MAANKSFQRRDTEKHMPPRNVVQPHRPSPRPAPVGGHSVPEREFWRELERRHERHARPTHV
jgi:hypothetical protein